MGKRRKYPAIRQNSGNRSQAYFAAALFFVIGLSLGYHLGQSRPATIPQANTTGPAGEHQPDFYAEETSLKGILLTDPRNLRALIRLGNLYFDHSRFQDAVDYYGRALELDPTEVHVRTDRGTSYWYLGDADRAIEEFQRSLEFEPDHPQTLYNLGIVQLHGKDNAGAARIAWEKLLVSNPGYEDRAKVQEMIASLTDPAPGAVRTTESETSSMKALMERMSGRPQ